MPLFDTFTFNGSHPGPRLVVLGAVHGNETCGAVAIRKVMDEIESGALPIVRGRLTMIPVTNRMAFENASRIGDRNLNRNLAPTADPQDNEDRIANELCPILADNEVLLDLHSFHSPGVPFVMVGPHDNSGTLEPFSHAAREEEFAARLGVNRAVDGWLDTYSHGVVRRGGSVKYGMGTTEYMRTVGGYGVTLECGQHDDAKAPGVAYAAIHRALAHLGLTDEPAPERVANIETLRLCEVVDRNDPADRFETEWSSFDPVRQGDVIGRRASGEAVRARSDGFVVFPNTRAEPGAEWFYFAQPVKRL